MFKILVVEDNDVFRKVFLDSMTQNFPENSYAEAMDSKEAQLKVSEFFPDIIFMDINLPYKNGLELASEIKKEHPGIMIIIVSNYDYPEYRSKAEEIGVDFFLSKSSMTEDKLITLMNNIVLH